MTTITPTHEISIRRPTIGISSDTLVDKIRNYLALTQPTIQLLAVVTGATALVMEGSLLVTPIRFTTALILLTMAGGSAKAFNQIIERDLDAILSRTRLKRPLPSGRLNVIEAVCFASTLGISAISLYGLLFNWFTALLVAGSMFFYCIVYTIYLKPRTAWNIIIGGAAGAMGPVICWGAATGTTSLFPWMLFLVVFFWNVPHFWALAIYYMDDYRRLPIPVLPVMIGEKRTWNVMIGFGLATIIASLGMAFIFSGSLFWSGALGLGFCLITLLIQGHFSQSRQAARRVFVFSIIYLMLLCLLLMISHVKG
jgi:heme o synthase